MYFGGAVKRDKNDNLDLKMKLFYAGTALPLIIEVIIAPVISYGRRTGCGEIGEI